MVTHDPRAASVADRVVFLSDGTVVDELREPTAAAVIDRLGSLEAVVESRSAAPTSPTAPADGPGHGTGS